MRIITARSIHELAARVLAAPADEPSGLVAIELGAGAACFRELVARATLTLREIPRSRWEEALADLLRDLDLDDSVQSLSQLRLRAAVLGADDSRLEVESEEIDRPDPFSRSLETLRCAGEGRRYRRKVGTHTDPVRPWNEVVEEFRGRGAVTRETWDQMTHDQRVEAFTVAHQSSAAVVQDIQRVVARSIDAGESPARAILRVQAAAESITHHHAETVYRNAVQSAYARGRYEHMAQPHVVAARPWWQVLTVRDIRTRKTHAHVNGWCMRADDPGWQATACPFGHNCRCRLVARSQKWVDANGPTIHSGPLPNLPDRGWVTKPPPMVSVRIANPAPPPPVDQDPPARPERPSKGPTLIQPGDRHLDRDTRRALEKLDSIDKTRARRIRPSDLGLRRPTKEERKAARSPFKDRGVDPESWAQLSEPRLETADAANVIIDRTTVRGDRVADVIRQAGAGDRAVAVKVGDRYHVIAGEENAVGYLLDDTIGGAGRIPLKVFDAPPPLAKRLKTHDEARDALAASIDPEGLDRFRDATQRALSTHGLMSRDNWRGLAGARRTIIVSKQALSKQFGAVALHAADGTVAHHPETMIWARQALESAARGQPVVSANAKALRSIVHEEVHGCGPDMWRAMSGPGVMLEEAVTDIAARRIVRRMLGSSATRQATEAMSLPKQAIRDNQLPAGAHPYDIPISRLLAVARKAAISEVEVEKACVALKGRGADTTVASAADYVELMARELVAQSGTQIPVQTLRDQLLQVLRGGLSPMSKPVDLERKAIAFDDLDGTDVDAIVAYFDQELAVVGGAEEAGVLAHALAMLRGGDMALWQVLLEKATERFPEG